MNRIVELFKYVIGKAKDYEIGFFGFLIFILLWMVVAFTLLKDSLMQIVIVLAVPCIAVIGFWMYLKKKPKKEIKKELKEQYEAGMIAEKTYKDELKELD